VLPLERERVVKVVYVVYKHVRMEASTRVVVDIFREEEIGESMLQHTFGTRKVNVYEYREMEFSVSMILAWKLID
jgi:hypothetical protein